MCIRDRCRHGRPRLFGDPEVRLRGLDPDPRQIPRGVIGVQLHTVPESAPRHQGSHGRRDRPGGTPAPARRCLGADRLNFAPKLIALDVDGTIVDVHNFMTPAVRDSVRAAAEAGIHIVISTGRSIPAVINAIEKVGLVDGLAVASNGAVVFSYDPPKVLHAITFDAREAVQLVLEQVPDAIVAVEELGVGYRVNKPFPYGEINGQMKLESVYELIAQPVTRVIIRAPEHLSLIHI